MKPVLFACVHNAGRSQMAAALFNSWPIPTRPAPSRPGPQPGERASGSRGGDAEVGIDLSGATPQLLTPELAGDGAGR